MILMVYLGPTFPLNERRRTTKLKRRLVCLLQSQQDCPKSDAMKTMELVFLLIFFSFTHSVKHSMTYFLTGSSGPQTFPEFVAVSMVDEVQSGYCDSNIKRAEPTPDWAKKIIKDDPQLLGVYTERCMTLQRTLKDMVELNRHFDQTGDVHILQVMAGCEWDNETEETTGFVQIGYDGEDFLVFDLKTLRWIASKPQAVIIERMLESYSFGLNYIQNLLTNVCPRGVNMSLDYGKSSLLRTDLPSVSLLQKTLSSPVSCFATGFYPHRADMFWRKDGEELHEERGEILPNHDGSFQLSVDLNVSSVSPDDWKKYECVFHLSGVKDDIITKLDKAVIRTNREILTDMTIPIIAAVVALAVILIAAAGFMFYKKGKASDNSTELSEQPNPEA
ncbi:major histocompatibility complex class I-related gene protein-like isoform X4 [Thunnus albacares]|uniref:major histocompatibility complex class I-related gene protein-like isoform X4 n=1 Tax=Thunnus albacares TaxID=8236 RepID=UPI001CF64F2B|nr:major histocompatibility complex class I-related gene protein-like isoform X4 [Thunnus albacares]